MMGKKEQEAVVEAVLFTMGQSVEVRQLAAALGEDRETAKQAVTCLLYTSMHPYYAAGGKQIPSLKKQS